MKDLELLRVSKTFYKYTDVFAPSWLFFFLKDFSSSDLFLSYSFLLMRGDLVYHEYRTTGKGFLWKLEREIERANSTSLSYVYHSFHR